MDLKRFLEILKRRAPVIVTVAFATVVVVFFVQYFLVQPTYDATVTVNVVLDVGVTNSGLYSDYTNRLLNTYSYIVQSDAFIEKVVALLNQSYPSLTVNSLRGNVKVAIVPSTSILAITIHNTNPYLARDLANTCGLYLVTNGRKFFEGSSTTTSQILEGQIVELESEMSNLNQKYADLQARHVTGPEVDILAQQIASKEEAHKNLVSRFEMQKTSEQLQSHNLTVVSSAALPRKPSNALNLTQIGLTLFVGLSGGFGLGLVLENLDTRIHSVEQLEQISDLPVLGVVPEGYLSPVSEISGKGNKKKAIARKDAYRVLALNLRFSGHDRPVKSILLTSAVGREGKSTVVANLGRAFSEQEQPVFLVDGDLRHSALGKFFGSDNKMGLSNLLNESAPIKEDKISSAITTTNTPSLCVIRGGDAAANNIVASLSSPRMTELMAFLYEQNKMIVLDSPAVLGMPDASILAHFADGVVIVVKKSSSRCDQVSSTVKQLRMVNSNILGFVFIGAD